MLKLLITKNAEKDEVVLEGDLVSIGRARTSDFRIMEASVSSNHAHIKKVGSSWIFVDLGSTNGTIINGKTVTENERVVLRSGDLLILGEVEIKVVNGDGGGAARPNAGGGGGGAGSNGGGRAEADQFLGKLINSSNRKIISGKNLRGKIVGIYFAARWCAACRGFTATLRRMYQELQDEGKPFEIVYVSSDQTTAQFNLYFNEMPWLAVPYADRVSRDGLAKLYQKKNVPYLVLLDEDGNTITTQGRVILPRLGAAGYPFKLDSHEAAEPPRGAPKVYPERRMNNQNKHVGFSDGRDREEDEARGLQEDFSKSKRFGLNSAEGADDIKVAASKKQTVEEMMEEEFAQIIGHDSLKDQLRQFHKKVQLDVIRRKADPKQKRAAGLYHMLFMGPPGTGKTTMANLVAKLMVKMELIETDNVVFVNNALDLLAGFVGQTSPKVDEKVEEARGGVLFIDEAYSIVKSDKNQKDSFGQEAIDCIMKHLDPPSCVFIFAGYEKPMEDFLGSNPGLSRRVPYRYTFEAYSDKHLIEIMQVMCKAKGEDLDHGVLEAFPHLLDRFDDRQKQEQNAGLINNWVSFAQGERDDRIDIEDAYHNPDIASLLCKQDFAAAIDQLRKAR